MSLTSQRCTPVCESFRCGQRALAHRGKIAFCNLASEECGGGTCSYALCARRKLLADGRCALFVKRKTEIPERIEEEEIPEIRLKGKLRRIPKEELF